MSTVAVQSAWRVLAKRYGLRTEQQELFMRYTMLLQQANQMTNITAITDERAVVELHFDDSLAITRFIDVSHYKGIADVGAGGGFPGIPLKIMFPHVPIFLIEVSQKKIAFLERVVRELQLSNIEIIALDWRTFLRKSRVPIDLFCARASLEIDELVRMFKPSCFYRTAQLVYWASESWQPLKRIQPYITKVWPYHIAGRERRLIMFTKNDEKPSE